MFVSHDIPLYKCIIFIVLIFLKYNWPWVVGLIGAVVLWRIRLPLKRKLWIAAIVIGLFIVGETIYHFFPGYIPGCDYTVNRKGGYKMPNYTIVNQKGGKYFMPYPVIASGFVKTIFPVPVKNAVGTIDIDNSITVLKFQGDTIPDQDIVAKDFLGEVNGDFDFGFCPVFSDEWIVYTQTRWAVVANIKTGKVISPILTMSLDDLIGGIVSLDTAKNLFVVNKLTPAFEGSHQMLNIMHLENDRFISLGEINGGVDMGLTYKTPWLVNDRKIITYDSAANKLLCHGSDLRPSTHPFVEIFNRNSGKFRKLKEMVIHPSLPFGLVVEVGKDLDWNKLDKMPLTEKTRRIKDALYKQQEIHALYLLRWDTSDTSKQYTAIHTDALSMFPPLAVKQYSRFSFSPDGKWLVFGHEDMRQDDRGNFIGGLQNPFFVALPVDEKNPFFMGKPLFLGRTMHPDEVYTTSAWATDPTAFVAADGKCMYKWDLDNLYMARTVNTPDTLFPLE